LSSDGTLTTYDTASAKTLSSYTHCHDGDIHCVDVAGGDIAISGSRDATVKVKLDDVTPLKLLACFCMQKVVTIC
jgi:WD40 repeat protein